jgi:hypothetical protein
MSKTFARIAVGSIVLGTAVLAPSAAQAKDPATINGSVTMAACPLTGFTDAVGAASVTGGSTFSVSVPATNGTEYDIRVRYSVAGATTTAKRIFSKSRDYLVTPTAGSAARSGTLTGNDVRIYRIDVVDTINEVLVYTSDGLVGCD